MKKIPFFLLAVLVVQYSIGQTETFDIAKYTPPKDFKREEKQGAVVYSNANDTTGRFCAIIIFAGTAGLGDAVKDFNLQWAKLAVKKYGAAPNPKTEKAQTADGWKTVTGASLFKVEGTDAYIILTVFSGFGKRFTVISTLNQQSYITQLDAFLETVRLDKTKSITKKSEVVNPNPETVNQKPDAIKSNIENRGEVSTGTGKFGHLIYIPIDGWKQTNYTNAVSFTPSDILPGYTLEMRVMESKPFSGTLQQAFAESWNDAVQQLQSTSADNHPYNILLEKKSYHGWEFIRGEGSIKNSTDDDFIINLFVIKLNGRLERIFVVSQQVHETYGDRPSAWKESPRYDKDVNNFLYSLKFNDWKEPVATTPGKSVLSGLYAGFKLNALNVPTERIAGLKGTYVYFYPDGRVYYPTTHISTQGLDGINTWGDADEHGRFWGTYTLNNNQGEMNLLYGKISIIVNAEGVILTTQNTKHQYVFVPSVDGAVFNGSYYFSGDWGNKPVPKIIFTPDGKFIDKGAINILNHLTTSYYDVTRNPGEGTYQVKNHTITFNYTDGRKVMLVFTGLNYNKKDQSPKTLTLSYNEDILLRR